MPNAKQLTETRNGEYIPVTKEEAAPPPLRPLRRLFSMLLWFVFLALLLFTFLMFGRQWYDSLLARLDFGNVVHRDQSTLDTGVKTQVKKQVILIYENRNGELVRVPADAEKYSAFVLQQIGKLEKARSSLLQLIPQSLTTSLNPVFAGMEERVDKFADWYFAYSTTYKLLWEALNSAAQHALSSEAMSMSDGISHDLEKYLHKHYEEIVLRPEINDPRLHNVYEDTLRNAHSAYLLVVADLKADFQLFIAKHTTHLQAPDMADIKAELDWSGQFNKVNVASYEKGPSGAVLGGTLAAGGAVVGKTLGGAVTKALSGKLAAPFVSKAVSAGGGAAAGTVAGPVGSVAGALGGLGVDYLLNEGIELQQRGKFVEDTRKAVQATRAEWEKTMVTSINDAVNVWLDDTIQLLPQYD